MFLHYALMYFLKYVLFYFLYTKVKVDNAGI